MLNTAYTMLSAGKTVTFERCPVLFLIVFPMLPEGKTESPERSHAVLAGPHWEPVHLGLLSQQTPMSWRTSRGNGPRG